MNLRGRHALSDDYFAIEKCACTCIFRITHSAIAENRKWAVTSNTVKYHKARNFVSSFHPLIYRYYVLSSCLPIYDSVDTNCGGTYCMAACSVKTERRSSLRRFPDPACYCANATVAKTKTRAEKKKTERWMEKIYRRELGQILCVLCALYIFRFIHTIFSWLFRAKATCFF